MKLFGAGLVLLATAAGVARVEEPSSKQVVAAFEKRYNRVRTLRADFVQRYTWGETTQVESGRVYFQKPGRMRWAYDSPEEKLFLTDGDSAYFYVPRERQVRRLPLKQASDWEAIFALWIGRVDLERIFAELEFFRVDDPEGLTRWQLRGRSRSPRQPFREVWLDLNQDYQVVRIEIRQRDDSLMEFHFRHWEENQPISRDVFRLSLPPGTAWIDVEPR